MSTKTKRTQKAKLQAISGQMKEGSLVQPALEEEIRRRAYEIYLERGALAGCDVEDWLQAERELARPALALAS
jgi:hypothetical protein